MTGYDRFVAALEHEGRIQPSWGRGTLARCPAHDDTKASLSVSEGDDGRALFFCHAGCEWSDVLAGLGLEYSQVAPGNPTAHGRVVAQYVYENEKGEPVFRVNRLEPKGFTQERYEDGAWHFGTSGIDKPLYRLPEVVNAVATGTPIYLVEGEKDVESIRACSTGVVATTSPGGATAWSDTWASQLAGGVVRVVPDRDDAGRKRATSLLHHLGERSDVSVVWPAVGNDASEHLYGGYTVDEFLPYEPYEERWMDWNAEAAETDWLWQDVLPRRALVWAYGATESGKSMCMLGIGSMLSHSGTRVTFYGEEQPRELEGKNLRRFGPDSGRFHWLNHQGVDLRNPDHVQEVISENRGTDLIVFDSFATMFLTDGQSDGNHAAIAFKKVADRIIEETGAAVVVIDHTGKSFYNSEGQIVEQKDVRGASAKRQQADVAIYFASRGKWDGGEQFLFTMEATKNRYGAAWTRNQQVVDTPGGGLAIATDEEAMALLVGRSKASEPAEPEPVEGAVSDSKPVSESFGPQVPLTQYEQRRRRQLWKAGMGPEEAAVVLMTERLLRG